MKKNYKIRLNSNFILLILGIALFSISNIHGQCTNGTLYPSSTFSVPCTGVPLAIATDSYAGEYSNINVLGGSLYTFNSSVSTDYVTITNSGGGLAEGGAVPYQYAPVAGQVVRFYLHKDASCTTENVNRTKYATCGAPCTNPSVLNATNISTNSFQVNWSGSATSYQIYVTDNTAVPTDPTTSTQQGIAGNAYIVNDAITIIYPNSTYRVWVRNECINNPNTWVGPLLVTTNAEAAYCNSATYGCYPQTTYTPTCSGNPETIVADAYASEFSKVNISSNVLYTFSSSNTSDYITITNEAGTAAYSAGPTPLVWNSGAISGVIRYHTYSNNLCGSQAANRTRFIKCTQPPCSAPSNLSADGVTASGATLHYSSSSTPSSAVTTTMLAQQMWHRQVLRIQQGTRQV